MRKLVAAVSVLLATIVVSFAANAQSGPGYFTITQPEKVSATDKIEVIEVFSYACRHCAEFQPLIDAWRKKLDTKSVQFAYLPAPYDARDTLLARGYLTAEKFGLVEKTHHPIFSAMKGGARVQTFQDVSGLYSQLGVPVAEFGKEAFSFDIENKMRRTLNLMIQYKIDSTPTLIIDGKYRITADSAGGQEAMLKVADELIKQLRAQSTATSRQAPSKGK